MMLVRSQPGKGKDLDHYCLNLFAEAGNFAKFLIILAEDDCIQPY